MSDDIVQNLKERLIGKTIIAIEAPFMLEAICRFVIDDGTSFNLHATDLGAWISEGPGQDGTYQTLTSFFDAAHDYSYKFKYNDRFFHADIINDNIEVETNTGKKFIIPRKNLTEEEKEIIAIGGGNFIEECCAMGDMWKLVMGFDIFEKKMKKFRCRTGNQK